jgi:hypothetical protein
MTKPKTVSVGNGKARAPRTGRAAKPGHDARVVERQRRALELRKSGGTYSAIARTLGTGVMTAHRDVKAALAAVVAQRDEDAGQLLALELERLDAVWLAMWPRAREGDAKAASVLVRVSARRAALCGLDSAQRVELSGGQGGPIVVSQDRPYEHWTTEAIYARLEVLRATLRDTMANDAERAAAETAPLLPAVLPETPEQRYARILAERRRGRND